MSWILISLMAAAATIVMLCFSNVWSDMQRRGDRESKMDFKAETSKVLRGARTRPVLLAEENLKEDLEKDPESRSHSIPRNVWVRFVFGCLFTWQCLQRITADYTQKPEVSTKSSKL